MNSIEHKSTTVPVASGAGYIQCSCGWRSEVEDDGLMFTPSAYSARNAFDYHVKLATEKPMPHPTGDWRDLSHAFSQVPDSLKRPVEGNRTTALADWQLVEQFLKHYPPLHMKCHYCKVDVGMNGYRCADCSALYCKEHIRPHFEGKQGI